PLGLLLLIAAVWSGLWFYAANRAEAEIEAWIQREATLGRAWSCADRSLAGFPFRFELICREPVLVTRGGDSLKITAARAHAVAQIWAPNHIVAEFESPARVEDTTSGRVYSATWSLLQMSGVGDTSGRPQRFSLVTEQPSLELILAKDAPPTPPLSAKHLDVHVRRSPALENRTLAAAGGQGPLDMTLEGSVTAAEDLRPMSTTDRLRAWANAGGILRVSAFRAVTPQAALSASGALSVDPQGRVFGAVDLGFAGMDQLLKGLAAKGLIAPELAPVVGALALAGKPGEVAGRKGSTFSVTIEQGTLKLGKFPVGIIPPVF
ncbi:MAG: hypothetical protein B7Z45_08920, partial [Azorhizobium sp. 12-66-6]